MPDQPVIKTENDIFVSYSRRNKEFVQRLVKVLNHHQYQTWIDWQDIPPLSPWRQEIERGIITAHNFLFALSADSLKSVECQKEIECALTYNKRLVPIVIGDVDCQTIPPALGDLNWIFFFGDGHDFNTGITKLLQALEIDLDYARIHTRLLARTHDWLDHDQDASYLLRGSELNKVNQWTVQEKERPPHLTKEQREFVLTSRQAETQRQTTLIRNQRRRLLAAGIALVMMGVLAGAAEFNRRLAVVRELEALSTASNAEYALGDVPAALLTALKAGKRLDNSIWSKRRPGLRQTVVSSLGQALYQIKEVNRLESPNGWIATVDFMPDGKAAVVGGQAGLLQIWQLDTQGSRVQSLDGHSDAVLATAVDGEQIVSGDFSGNIHLWRRQQESWLSVVNWKHNSPIRTLLLSTDGEVIGGDNNGQITIWSANGQLQQSWQAHKGEIWQLRRTATGQLVSIGRDQRVAIWQSDGTLVRSWLADGEGVYAIAISPQNQRLLTGHGDGMLKRWTWDGQLLNEWSGHQGQVWDIEFNDDAQQMITVGEDRAVLTWNTDGQLLGKLEGHRSVVNDVSISSINNRVITASNDRTARLWQPQKTFPTELYHTAAVYRAAYLSDSQLLATAGEAGQINLWQQDSDWQQVKRLQGHTQRINSLAVSPDGQLLASGSSDERVRLWQIDAGTSRSFNHQKAVVAVAFSPDGQSLFASDFDRKVIQWRLDGSQANAWEMDTEIYAIRHSPDGEMMALAGADGKIYLRTADGNDLNPLDVAESTLYDLVFSPDGGHIISGSDDGNVRVHTLEGELVHTYSHGSQVWTVAVYPESPWIASGGADGTVKLWSIEKPDQPSISLAGHQLDVENLVFLDKNQLISTSSDRKAILWDLSILKLDSLIHLTCDWWQDYLQTGPGLTDSERQLCQ